MVAPHVRRREQRAGRRARDPRRANHEAGEDARRNRHQHESDQTRQHATDARRPRLCTLWGRQPMRARAPNGRRLHGARPPPRRAFPVSAPGAPPTPGKDTHAPPTLVSTAPTPRRRTRSRPRARARSPPKLGGRTPVRRQRHRAHRSGGDRRHPRRRALRRPRGGPGTEPGASALWRVRPWSPVVDRPRCPARGRRDHVPRLGQRLQRHRCRRVRLRGGAAVALAASVEMQPGPGGDVPPMAMLGAIRNTVNPPRPGRQRPLRRGAPR